MSGQTPAQDEQRKRIGKALVALGALCLAASIALLIAAQMILRTAGR